MQQENTKPRTLILEATIGDALCSSDEQFIEKLNSMFYLSKFKLVPSNKESTTTPDTDHDLDFPTPAQVQERIEKERANVQSLRVGLLLTTLRKRLNEGETVFPFPKRHLPDGEYMDQVKLTLKDAGWDMETYPIFGDMNSPSEYTISLTPIQTITT